MMHPFHLVARHEALRSFPGDVKSSANSLLQSKAASLVPESGLLYCKVAVDKLFISANSLLRDSMELARLVVSSGFRPTFLVAMWRGGAPIGIAVQEVLQYHSIIADHIAIRTSSYTGIDQQDKTVRVHAIDYLVSRLSAEDELLLVDDVFDSGRSLEAVIRELKQRCRRNWPEKWRIATVYYKSSRNRSSLMPDYYVLDTDKWLVFPHELIGLTREEILEHKPVGPDFFETP
jgi:hypoxanthine phosphoribosyltransferase